MFNKNLLLNGLVMGVLGLHSLAGNAITVEQFIDQNTVDNRSQSFYSVYRPADGTWWISAPNGNWINVAVPNVSQFNKGLITKTAKVSYPAGGGRVVAEYPNLAAFDDSTGITTRFNSDNSNTTIRWGFAGDVPLMMGDSELLVWRPTEGSWWDLQPTISISGVTSGGMNVTYWGQRGDTPMLGRYFDNPTDGKSEYVVYRPNPYGGSSSWWFYDKTNNKTKINYWGLKEDVPVSGDFNGDGFNDMAVWRKGEWYIFESNGNSGPNGGSIRVEQPWNGYTYVAGDKPVPYDYDGDGKTDLAVWRPSNGTWYIKCSSAPVLVTKQWGLPGDIPLPFVVRRTVGNWH